MFTWPDFSPNKASAWQASLAPVQIVIPNKGIQQAELQGCGRGIWRQSFFCSSNWYAHCAMQQNINWTVFPLGHTRGSQLALHKNMACSCSPPALIINWNFCIKSSLNFVRSAAVGFYLICQVLMFLTISSARDGPWSCASWTENMANSTTRNLGLLLKMALSSFHPSNISENLPHVLHGIWNQGLEKCMSSRRSKLNTWLSLRAAALCFLTHLVLP